MLNPVAPSSRVIAPTASTPPVATPPVKDATPPLAGGGVQGAIGDALRASAGGYLASTKVAAVEVDKGMIYPFESVATATGLLKEKTAGIKGLSKATSILHTVGGFALLILSSNLSATVRAPGETAVDLANRVADAIDGRESADGWFIGWNTRAGASSTPSAFGSLGMH